MAEISHVIFVVHGVGQVVDDSSIIRNTNIMRDNMSQTLGKLEIVFCFHVKILFIYFKKIFRLFFHPQITAKHYPKFQMETGQRAEFFPVEWRSSLRLDEGMVRHITPYRIMGLRNLLNSSGNNNILYFFSNIFSHPFPEFFASSGIFFPVRFPVFPTSC